MTGHAVPAGPQDGREVLAMSEDRLRWEVATLAGRLRTCQAERDDWQARHDEAARERDRQRAALRAVRGSRAYRLGSALLSLARRRPAAPPRPRAERQAPPETPAHVYVAIGLTPETLRTFTRALAQRILVHADHLPVVVTDCPEFRSARIPGVMLEYLPDAPTWRRHRPDVPWDDVLTERLARLFQDHRCVRTAVIDPQRPPALADLLDSVGVTGASRGSFP